VGRDGAACVSAASSRRNIVDRAPESRENGKADRALAHPVRPYTLLRLRYIFMVRLNWKTLPVFRKPPLRSLAI
jgi:hypothetical protein